MGILARENAAEGTAHSNVNVANVTLNKCFKFILALYFIVNKK